MDREGEWSCTGRNMILRWVGQRERGPKGALIPRGKDAFLPFYETGEETREDVSHLEGGREEVWAGSAFLTFYFVGK